jgi:hypothetical protein
MGEYVLPPTDYLIAATQYTHGRPRRGVHKDREEERRENAANGPQT